MYRRRGKICCGKRSKALEMFEKKFVRVEGRAETVFGQSIFGQSVLGHRV